MTKPSQPRPKNIASSRAAISFGPPTMASWVWPRPEQVMKSRVLGLVLPLVRSTPSRMPIMPCMPPSSSDVSGSSMPFAAKAKFSPPSTSQQAQRIDFQRQLFDQRHLVFGLGPGRAGHRCHQIAKKHLIGIAAGLGGLVPDRVVALLGVRQISRRREDDFAPSSGEALAAAAGAGLDDDGVALLRARHRERPARFEKLPAMIEAFDLVRIGEPARLFVDQERTVFPGILVVEHHCHDILGAGL